ncbi:MAG: hypothetical protein E6R13_10285 [Spirochaetes bacterium]|nr:MAG: hypothetical protein E6R13_10285 [Spirochaetota bacterium]
MEDLISINKIKKILFSLVLVSSISSVFAYTVQVSNVDGGGSVTLNGSTGGVVSGSFNAGDIVYISANPDSNKTFSSWSGGYTTSSSIIRAVVSGNINITAGFSNRVSSIMSINNKCVNRVINYQVTGARALNGVYVPATYAQVYVLEGSSFSTPSQDVTGYLPQSPNQSFYYAFNAGVVGAGTYLGSNSAFAGNTTYLSLGSATVLSDVHYSCQTASVSKYVVSFDTNLPVGVSATLTGAGTYNVHSNVTLTAYPVDSYKLTSISGFCGSGSQQYDGTGSGGYAFSVPFDTVKSSYNYTLQDLQNNCSVRANYTYIPPNTNLKYTVHLSAGYDNGGTVTVNGNTSADVTLTANAGTVINISANPSSGYTFYNWTGSLAGKSSSYSFILTGNVNETATFQLNSNTAQTSGSCGAVAKTLLVNSYPVNTAGYMNWVTGGIETAHSFPQTFGNGLFYNLECSSFSIPTPQPNQGYVFKTWIGNLGTTTMSMINAGNSIYPYQFNNVATPTITAVFEFNGAVNTAQAGETFSEVLATSEFGYISSNLSAPNVNEKGVFPVSPYTIDSKCVNTVVSFKAKRVTYYSILGITTPAPRISDSYTYVYLFGLDGSDLSATLNGNIYNFKSDPSEWVVRSLASPYEMPAGSYTSDMSSFSFKTNNVDYIIDQSAPIKTDKFSCTSRDVSASTIKPFYIPPYFVDDGYRFNTINGYSYLSITSPSFINVNGLTASTTLSKGIDKSVGYPFIRVKCSDMSSFPTKQNISCASSLDSYVSNHFIDYKYMWVFSSKPLEGFYKQVVSNPDSVYYNNATPIYGLFVYPKVLSVKLKGDEDIELSSITNKQFSQVGSSTANVTNAPLFATKIDLTKCKFYKSAEDYGQSILNDAPVSCLDVSYGGATYQGSSVFASSSYYSLMFNDSIVSGTGLLTGMFFDSSYYEDDDVLFYGGLFTSNNMFSVVEGENITNLLRNRICKDVKNINDCLNVVKSDNWIDSEEVEVSSETVDGHWQEVAGYWQEVAGYWKNATATVSGGSISMVSGDYLLSYTSGSGSVSFSTSTNGQLLVVGGGGGGGGANTTKGTGAGGAGGYVISSSSYLFNTGSLSISIGSGGSAGAVRASGTNGATTTFDTLVAGGGGFGGGSDYNGGNGANGGGAGGSNAGNKTGGTGYQGYNGASQTSSTGGAGGAGSGGSGSSSSGTTGGAGGSGVSSSITGSSVTYGCGGGGAGNDKAGASAGCSTAGAGNSSAGSAGNNATAVEQPAEAPALSFPAPPPPQP